MVVKRTENEALWINIRPDDPDICDYLENCLLPNSLYIIDPNLYWMITFLRTSELEKATRPLARGGEMDGTGNARGSKARRFELQFRVRVLGQNGEHGIFYRSQNPSG